MGFGGQTQVVQAEDERRTSRRLAVALQVVYCVHLPAGGRLTDVGRTIDISSDGLLFESISMPVGATIGRSIGWPLNARDVRLALWASGRVVRATEGQVAVKLDNCEFRVGA